MVFILMGMAGSSYAFPKHHPVPGGVAVIPLFALGTQKPKVIYQNTPVLISSKNGLWVAIVGIPLSEKAKNIQTLKILNPQTKQFSILNFSLKTQHYRTQYLRIRDKNKVNPNATAIKRILREKNIKNRLRATYTQRPVNLNLIKPVAGRDTGRFGLRRFINRQKRNSHTGMDIAAGRGVPVKATTDGKVLFTGNFFFSGNVIYIDHHQGLISAYAHLSSIHVKVGDIVKKGMSIGKVGSTGRTTGPHLHWGIYLNKNAINPKYFIR